jgi:hypothetical protein
MYENTTPAPITQASVQYDDLVGTAAADRADALVHNKSVEELTGLTETPWKIVGYRIYRSASSWNFHLFAANADELGIKSHDDFARVEKELGHIPVRDFALPHVVDPEKVFAALFKRFSVEMTYKGISNLQLAVTGGDDLPFGDTPAEK